MDPQSIQNVFWTIATENRIGLLKPISITDLLSILTTAKMRGFLIGWKDIHPLLKLIDRKQFSDWAPPNFVTDFVISYLSHFSGKRVLDPNCGMGTFVFALQDAISAEITAISPSQEHVDFLSFLDLKRKIDWHLGPQLERLESIQDKYDFVLSFPPYNLPVNKKTFEMRDGKLVLTDALTNFIVLEACRKLKDDGRAVFLLPESFYNLDDFDGVMANFSEFNLYVNSIISLPQNVLLPWTNLSTSLFFISKKRTDNIFVGRLVEEAEKAVLLNNLINQKDGRSIEMGRIVSADEYKSWRQYSLQADVKQFVKKNNLPVRKVEEIASKINLGDASKDDGFEDLPNSVYVPIVRDLESVSRLSDLRSHKRNYFQLILKPEIALADYVAGYFNTELGKKVRTSLAQGSVVAKLSRLDLMDALVILPSMDVQQKVINAQRTISELALGLAKLGKDLFQNINDVAKIEKQIIKLDREKSFETWIETLPFPLASILWMYQASLDVDEKNRHLLHFFEGIGQFMSTLMLSAFYSDQKVIEKHRKQLFDYKDSSVSLRRSTFGNWVTIGEKLAKITRKMLSSSEGELICYNLYRTDSKEFFDAITSKSLFSVLRNALKYRNDFAHSGIENSFESKRKLSLLESELGGLRQLFVDAFEDVILIKPKNNQYQDGVYDNQFLSIMGSRQKFNESRCNTVVPLDSRKLYFGGKDSERHLELLPFVKLFVDVEMGINACYFYNRMNGNQVRWITYHHEPRPEMISIEDDLAQLIEFLEEKK